VGESHAAFGRQAFLSSGLLGPEAAAQQTSSNVIRTLSLIAVGISLAVSNGCIRDTSPLEDSVAMKSSPRCRARSAAGNPRTKVDIVSDENIEPGVHLTRNEFTGKI
jgi:hypothetical protein